MIATIIKAIMTLFINLKDIPIYTEDTDDDIAYFKKCHKKIPQPGYGIITVNLI